VTISPDKRADQQVAGYLDLVSDEPLFEKIHVAKWVGLKKKKYG
jgi:hypothetical protein